MKITQIGNSVGIELPKEVLERLRVSKGDTLTISETPSGVNLTARDSEFERQMDLAEAIMRKGRDVLHRLSR